MDQAYDFIAKFFAIIAGISASVGLYLSIRDRLPLIKLFICLKPYNLPVDRDNFGGFHNREVPAIIATIINNGKSDIYIAEVNLYVDGNKTELNPHEFFSVSYSSGGLPCQKKEPLSPGRRKKAVYYGQKLLNAADNSKTRFTIWVELISETGKRYATSKIKVTPKDLVDINASAKTGSHQD